MPGFARRAIKYAKALLVITTLRAVILSVLGIVHVPLLFWANKLLVTSVDTKIIVSFYSCEKVLFVITTLGAALRALSIHVLAVITRVRCHVPQLQILEFRRVNELSSSSGAVCSHRPAPRDSVCTWSSPCT